MNTTKIFGLTPFMRTAIFRPIDLLWKKWGFLSKITNSATEIMYIPILRNRDFKKIFVVFIMLNKTLGKKY